MDNKKILKEGLTYDDVINSAYWSIAKNVNTSTYFSKNIKLNILLYLCYGYSY